MLHKNRMVLVSCFLTLTLSAGAPSFGYPSDPDNAALLYYQAFLAVPEVEEPTDTQLRDYAEGKIELNNAMEDYVGSCRNAVPRASTCC